MHNYFMYLPILKALREINKLLLLNFKICRATSLLD
jgi:hypothetical protein